MKNLGLIAAFLLIIGGINWGLVGIMKKDIFTTLGVTGVVPTIFYILVGVSAVIFLMDFTKKLKPATS